jgi:hypothetical protein
MRGRLEAREGTFGEGTFHVLREAGSGNQVADHLTVDIGESEIAAGVAEGEFFVIETEQRQEGGVEIVDVDGFLGGLESEFVGGAVDVGRRGRRRRRSTW